MERHRTKSGEGDEHDNLEMIRTEEARRLLYKSPCDRHKCCVAFVNALCENKDETQVRVFSNEARLFCTLDFQVESGSRVAAEAIQKMVKDSVGGRQVKVAVKETRPGAVLSFGGYRYSVVMRITDEKGWLGKKTEDNLRAGAQGLGSGNNRIVWAESCCVEIMFWLQRTWEQSREGTDLIAGNVKDMFKDVEMAVVKLTPRCSSKTCSLRQWQAWIEEGRPVKEDEGMTLEMLERSKLSVEVDKAQNPGKQPVAHSYHVY